MRTPLHRGSRRDHRVRLAEGRRSRGVHPVVSDSGGRLDVGFSRLRLGLPQSLAPRPLRAGRALGARNGPPSEDRTSRVGADESCSVRGFDKNRDAKSAQGPQDREPRDAGEPAVLKNSDGSAASRVTLLPHVGPARYAVLKIPITRAARIARARTCVQCHPRRAAAKLRRGRGSRVEALRCWIPFPSLPPLARPGMTTKP